MKKKKSFFQRAKGKIRRTFFDKNKKPKPDEEKIKILLLTNRDSDNVGDQVIEACDISLISTVMKNLGLESDDYKISSRAAGIISKKYLATRDPELLRPAEEAVRKADLIVFGGAPLFNYSYQVFYERTAITLELAEKYNKPVIFSAIGVEGYDEDSEKCQRLKKTLNFDCVKQITTRDNYEALKKFKDNENLIIDKVADPAVFTAEVFEKFISPKGEKKKIGIFILRANGFVDNKVNFTKYDAAELWKGLTFKLEEKGYDYELLTSGHFGDEAFLDYMIRECGVDAKKCIFNINSPEKLISKVSSYDAVVSTRLHPSIISFSLGVPSVGIVWNSKVTHFYDSIGCGDRILETEGITPEKVMEKIELCLDNGISKDSDYLISVYNTLFEGIRNAVLPEKKAAKPYTFDELKENIKVFNGTSQKEKDEKLKRKFRRTYNSYNALFEKNVRSKEKISQLNEEVERLKEELGRS